MEFRNYAPKELAKEPSIYYVSKRTRWGVPKIDIYADVQCCIYADNVGGWIRKSILSKDDQAAIDPSAFQNSSRIPLKSALRIQMTSYLQKSINCSCLQK